MMPAQGEPRSAGRKVRSQPGGEFRDKEKEKTMVAEKEIAAERFIDSLEFEGPLIFDIETGPLPDNELEAFFRFDPTKVRGFGLLDAEFDPESVKYGNTIDPEKRAAKLAAAKEKFIADQMEAKQRFEKAEQDAFDEFREKAALDARTCQVLTIAYMDVATGAKVLDDGGDNEYDLLWIFWDVFSACRQHLARIIGFNSNSFDVPVLARRAMQHRIPLPEFRNGRYLDNLFVDLRDVWGCGEFNPRGDLDSLSVFFDGPPKNGEGKDFHQWWNGTEEEHEQAIAYALNDLDMTLAVAKGLQVV